MSLGEELHPLSPKPHKEQGLMKPWHLGTIFIIAAVIITIMLILILIIAILLIISKLVIHIHTENKKDNGLRTLGCFAGI